MAKESATMRLNQQQNPVAFQYAQLLDHAYSVFGGKPFAEQWLNSPCKHLEGQIPLELLDNALGFERVEGYLTRIEYGVYQ
ncbi:antitoxin Xre/MbcA/ParS toxin-binding domain-containing protein [Pseudomonas sp. S2_E01]